MSDADRDFFAFLAFCGVMAILSLGSVSCAHVHDRDNAGKAAAEMISKLTAERNFWKDRSEFEKRKRDLDVKSAISKTALSSFVIGFKEGREMVKCERSSPPVDISTGPAGGFKIEYQNANGKP